MTEPQLDDVRSSDPVERLMEDSWTTRSRRPSRREVTVESVAALLFFACAIPLAVLAPQERPMDPLLAVTLVGIYALASRMVKFPIGAGYVVPSYLVLVPMLLLLPAGTVPLLAAAGLALGTLAKVIAERDGIERVVLSIPDAWHALGPALVLVLAGPTHGGVKVLVYVAAFVSGCLIDLASATVRESAIMGVRPQVQVRVIAQVWLIDACVAPLGLVIAGAARHEPREVLLILPLIMLLLLASRDRSARIESAQRRLTLVARERSRLQTAVRRLGDALAAKLDVAALTDIVLRGSIEAIDADAGRLTLGGALGGFDPRELEIGASSPALEDPLRKAAQIAETDEKPCQLERAGVWALALPFGFSTDEGKASGALAVAREGRAFGEDEETVVRGLVERAREAAADIVRHQRLREQALTDALTKLGNRRKLAADVDDLLGAASTSDPLVLILFDLDGFKRYNDTFGHLAGDAMLARLGGKLAAATTASGAAYRLGGDEFCVLIPAHSEELCDIVSKATEALEEEGENFAVGASYGAVLLPHEATNLDLAMQLADERMYALKRVRSPGATDQTRDVLVRIMQAKQPDLQEHSRQVADLCTLVARRFRMTDEQIEEMVRAAELHDIGKVGIPDAILDKPGSLDDSEWEFMRQHTVLGERILSAAPTLKSIATIVRATHERWDGRGYPDGLATTEIPLAARIIAACDTYAVMTTDRCYRQRMTHDTACAELRFEAGHQLDPEVVAALLDELEATEIPDDAPADGAEGDQAGNGASQAPDAVVAYLRDALARHKADRPHREAGPVQVKAG